MKQLDGSSSTSQSVVVMKPEKFLCSMFLLSLLDPDRLDTT